ncbi:MAG: hypothetical protein ACPHF4_03435 [Rubripirellula sp.]
MQSHYQILIQGLQLLLLTPLGTHLCLAQADSRSEQKSEVHNELQTLQVTSEQAKDSIQWLATKASRHIPRTISGDKNWGDTKRVWAGVKIRMDGFKLRTNRRHRELEQGRWIKYQVTLPDIPPAIKVADVSPSVDAVTGEQSWTITSSIVSPMEFEARVQRWNLGVRLFSVTIRGKARIRMNSTISVGFHANYGEIPPGLVIAPSVQKAELVMEHFEVDRVSKIGGDVAEEWGELLEELLIERLVKRQNEKLVGKLNNSIDKERDELKLSLAEWLENWGRANQSADASASAASVTTQAPAN